MRTIAEQYGTIKQNDKAGYNKTSLKEWRDNLLIDENTLQNKTVKYFDEGKEVVSQVPREIYNAATQLDPITSQMFSNVLARGGAKVASVMRAGTILAPGFALARNPIFDQFAAYLNTPTGYNPLFYTLQGLGSIINRKTGGKLFPHLEGKLTEFEKSGGPMASYVDQDRLFTTDVLKIIHESHTPPNAVPLTQYGIDSVRWALNPKNWIGALRSISSNLEDATRVGRFIYDMERGLGPYEAALGAREVTLDFARIGAATKGLNAISAFLNANLQGADRQVRQIVSDPLGTTSRVVAGVVIPSILFAMVNEEYKQRDPDSAIGKALREIPNWERNAYWTLPTPITIFKMPKPREYAPLITGIIERGIEYLYKKDPDTPYLKMIMENDIYENAARSFMLDPWATFSAMLPTSVKPIAEVGTNFNFFTGTPLIPPGMENSSPNTRYNPNTSELAKVISNKLYKITDPVNPITQRFITPMAIEHLIQGYSGTLGIDLFKTISSLGEMTGALEQRIRPEKGLSDIPFIKAFMVKYPNGGSASVEKFFKDAAHLEQRRAAISKLREDSTATAKDMVEYEVMRGIAPRFTPIRNNLGAIAKAIRTIQYTKELDPHQKREYIEQMYWNMIDQAKVGNELIKEFNKVAKQRQEALNAYPANSTNN